ncbi:MAG: hypothetical protein CML56_04545 [Rhodobacteraceae bacterium]|nr:hypothetical protein [Paracoccaceae bacterium]
MDDLEAIEIIESKEDSTRDEEVAAWQQLINTGTCWDLQGFYGRTAIRLIEEGVCHEASQR